ncbi:MAG: HDOD domain-containing protein [Pseudomonadota bacterium]
MIFEGVILALVAVGLLWLWLRKPGSKKPGAKIQRSAPPKAASQVANNMKPASDSTPAPPPLRAIPDDLEHLRLRRRGELTEAEQAAVLEVCAAMPEPHPVQTQMAGGLDTPEELTSAVVTDAGLTASILRTVNSAAFALATPITSVQHAVNYLGVGVVKGLVAQAVVSDSTVDATPEQQAAMARIWQSACCASALAQSLGQELGLSRPSILATKSLFFNLGDVAIVLGVDDATQWYAEGVSIVDRITAQQQASGANTAIVGAALAQEWNLPVDLVAAIETGFLPLVTKPGEHPMEGDNLRSNVIVYFAGRIGEIITYRGLRDVGELELDSDEDPGLFHLPGHLESAGLGRATKLLSDPSFRRKANRLVGAIVA